MSQVTICKRTVAQSLDRATPVGFRIRLLRPHMKVQATIGIQTIVVRLQFRGNNRPAAVYIDSRRSPGKILKPYCEKRFIRARRTGRCICKVTRNWRGVRWQSQLTGFVA